MKKEFFTLDDFEFRDKTILLRVDINVPVKDGKIEISDRLIEAAKTIKELSDKCGKVVILAHQGRKGNPDFIHLNQHAEALSKYVGKKVEFVDDIVGKKAKEKIKSMKEGEIILLDNVRLLPDETEEKTPQEHSNSQIVKTLSPLADFFVNDAFSAAHRSHASIVGFTNVLPSIAGRLMEKEVNSCEKALNPEHPTVFILGGAKPDDCLKIMKFMLENQTLDCVLICGVLGELFLSAKGYILGKPTADFLAEKGYYKLIPEVKEMFNCYKDKIELPEDVAFEEDGERKEISIDELPVDSQILDIGRKTIEKYSKLIKKAKTIVVKGPAGVYEKEKFNLGTKLLLEAVADSGGFSLVGGGDTTVAMKIIGIDKRKFSYVSLAGGALITYLSGKPMPGIEALKESYKKYSQLTDQL